MDGTDGLTGLLNSLKSLQESVERLATSTEASYARIGKAAKAAEAIKAAEAAKTEGIREREAAKTAATLEKLDAQTAANRAKLADQTAATQAQANAKSEAEAARHAQRMAVLAEQGAQAAAVAQARIAEIQARTNSTQLLAAQRLQAELAKVAAVGAQAQATATARASAEVTAEQGKAQARQATIALEGQNELAAIAAKGQAKLAEIAATGANRINEIQLRADSALELEEQRSLNRRTAAREKAMERMAASAGGGFGLGGMGSAILGAMGGKAVYDANVKDQGFYYTLLGMDNNDRAQAIRDQAAFYKIADDHGQNALKVAQQASGLFAAGKSAGLTSDQILRVISGFDDAFQARHTDQSHQNRTLLALTEMLGSDKVQAGRAIRQLTADMPGLAVDEFHLLNQQAPNVFKTEGDMRNVMEGKAGADGKKYTINPLDFVPLLAQYESKQWSPAAKEASETGVQSAMGRFQNALQSLLVEFGKAGAMDAFVNVMKELTATLKDPGVRASVHDMGAQLKEWSKNLGPLIQQTVVFIKTHKDGIETVGKVIGAVVAFNLAFKALVSPFVTLGGHAVMLGKNVGVVVKAFEKTASFFGGGLLTFLDAFKPGIKSYLTSFGGMIANGLKSALSAVASAAQGALRSMASSLGLKGLGIAAVGATAGYGAYQTYSSGHSVNDYLKLRDSKGLGKFSDEELKDAQASVEAARGQWNNQLYWKLGGGKARKQELDDLASQLQTQAATRDMNKRVGESNAKKAADAKAAEADKAASASMPPLLTPGADKKKKGRGEGSTADIGAAQRDASEEYQDRKAQIERAYDEEEQRLKQLLQDGKLGFEQYYNERRANANKEYDDEIAAVKKKEAAELAAEQERGARAAKAGNKVGVGASAENVKTINARLDKELLDIERQREKTLKSINDEHDKETKAYEKSINSLRMKVAKETGQQGVGADVSDIQEKYAAELKKAQEMGTPADVATVQNAQRLDEAHARYGSIKDDIGTKNEAYDNQIGAIQNQVAAGELSQEDADNQILAIKKQMAEADLQMLEQAKALNGPVQDQLAINKEILAAKAQIAQQSKMEQEIQKDIANDLAQALDKVMTGKERPIQAGKQFLLTLSEQIEGKLSQSVADEIVAGLKQGFDQANGSSNIFSQLVNGLENALKTAFNIISGSSSSSGGGFLSTLFNGVSSLFGGGGGSDSSGGFNFTMPDGSSGSSLSLGDAGAGLGSLYGVGAGMTGLAPSVSSSSSYMTSVNMNVSTPNLGSFAQSQSQIASAVSTRLAMANARN
ncbi:hypothetical protein WI88_09905 [Burkholderia ubonensis]|nr:hypothetical protein WI88_09905 [Burkholderia ubonensis]